jgi:hypothetical protein
MANALSMLDNYCYIHTHTHRICNNAFPWQQWLRERASILRYTYFACFVHVKLSGTP